MKKNKIQNLTFTALMAAILCIAGPIVIPIGMVPISFANMVIYLNILLFDKIQAVTSTAVYLLIGLTGIPVFSGFTGGAGKLLGPTGGYLIGYLFLCWLAGTILEVLEKLNGKTENSDSEHQKQKTEKKSNELRKILALSMGTIGVYCIGTIWLMYQSNLTFVEALSVGVLPFVVFDAVKMVAAVGLGNSIKKRMRTVL